MIYKIIATLGALLLVAPLQAQSFEQFLAESLQKSPLLKSNALSLKQADQKANLTTRYKNPTLSLEASNFSPDIGDSAIGYRAAISQPIRLWGISSSREGLAQAQKEQTQASVKLSRANFVLQLSSLYAEYKRSILAQQLAQEELLIAQNIANISKERYESGTIARVRSIEASLDVQRVKNSLAQTAVAKTTAYYRLMGFRGLNEEIEVDASYVFTLSSSIDSSANAQIEFSRATLKSASANAALNANKLEWINLVGEFEQEPNQSIVRVGVDIPLVIFNTKSQEKRIAKLQVSKAEFMTENLSQQLKFKLLELNNAVLTLQEVEKTSQELLTSQRELLAMYEEGYKIASIDLIELQTIKNQLIQTKANLLNITLLQELNIIEHNFLTGTYND
ncbi:Heavy metal RND efflux outer membrane protein, CzcC family [hydrothermal vent metagenome]|uniref:Heavy metal RND efflux outer membrane protein, CzcC family n=1 Tax=hydrothermal vent metagenome TaxID=652676 RepID=A0A1W1BJR0_9ZZZZ